MSDIDRTIDAPRVRIRPIRPRVPSHRYVAAIDLCRAPAPQVADALGVAASQYRAWVAGDRPVPARYLTALREMATGAVEAGYSTIGEAVVARPETMETPQMMAYIEAVREAAKLLNEHADAS